MTDVYANHNVTVETSVILDALKEWHRIVAMRDWQSLPSLLAENVVFRSPAPLEEYQGKETMVAILRAVFDVMSDFVYLRHFSSRSGYVLEFSARVGDNAIVGVDLIEFSPEGKISDFMVMMRPANVVLNLSSEAVKRLATYHSSDMD